MVSMGDGPLVTVIKLHSAESANNRLEAEKYIDVKSAYDPTKYTEENSKNAPTAEDIYSQYLRFINILKKDKKFTSEFMYYKYNISEKFDGNVAEVAFEAKRTSEIIIYKLNCIDGHWIVVDIFRQRVDRP
jgi:hypothetical protein